MKYKDKYVCSNYELYLHIPKMIITRKNQLNRFFLLKIDVILKIDCFIFLIQPSHSKINRILSTLGSLAVEAID